MRYGWSMLCTMLDNRKHPLTIKHIIMERVDTMTSVFGLWGTQSYHNKTYAEKKLVNHGIKSIRKFPSHLILFFLPSLCNSVCILYLPHISMGPASFQMLSSFMHLPYWTVQDYTITTFLPLVVINLVHLEMNLAG